MASRRRIGLTLALSGLVGIGLGVLLGGTDEPVEGFDLKTDAILPKPVEASEARVSEPAPPPPALEGLPVYPGATPSPLGETAAAGGVPLDVAWFETDDAIEDVMAWYENRLSADESLTVVSHQFSGNSGYVGYRDGKTDVMHVVSFVRQGEGTMVIPSRARAGDLLHAEQRLPEWFPAPEGATGGMIVEMGEANTRQESVSALVKGADLLRLVEFYREALSHRGWKVEKARRESPSVGLVDASRPGQRLQVYLSRPEETDATVQLYATLIRSS